MMVRWNVGGDGEWGKAGGASTIEVAKISQGAVQSVAVLS